jgi:hypothetical protein
LVLFLDVLRRQLVAQASEQGRLLRLKIVLTFVIVFATVLLRSAFYVLYDASFPQLIFVTLRAGTPLRRLCKTPATPAA